MPVMSIGAKWIAPLSDSLFEPLIMNAFMIEYSCAKFDIYLFVFMDVLSE